MLFITGLVVLQCLLTRYSGQQDICIGVSIANRNWSETEELLGFLTNTVVLRTKVARHLTFRQLLGRVRETSSAAYEHQDLPFEKLVEELQPDRDLSRNPLFQ